MSKEGTYDSNTSNGTLNHFNLDELNRPANNEEYKGIKKSPCVLHDKETEKEELIVEQVKRLKLINENIIKKEIREFESGAKRDGNSNKPYIHNLLGYTRQRFGYHMTKGSNKYGDGNWLKGLPTDCYLESIDRHLAAYMDGDRSEDHLSAIMFGIQGCMINEKKEGIKSDYYFNKLS